MDSSLAKYAFIPGIDVQDKSQPLKNMQNNNTLLNIVLSQNHKTKKNFIF